MQRDVENVRDDISKKGDIIQHCINDMIGNQYADSYFSDGENERVHFLKNGDISYKTTITIIDEHILSEKIGRCKWFVAGETIKSRQIKLISSKEYEYELEKNWLGYVFIRYNGHKYQVEMDDNDHVVGINMF